MASLGNNPRTWIPYMNNKDCSQEFCSFNCPQWCYTLYPSPPPYEYTNDHDSTPKFSPLIIAIIGVLAVALLLLSYYTIMSKYHRRRRENHDTNDELNHNDEPWHVSSSTTRGLDEDLIKSIMVSKYKKAEADFVGLFNDCSVCLTEFQDGECVRVMPECGHAFHLPCIDTWLKSHSSCPLCRATIFTFNNTSSVLQAPSPVVIELPSMNNQTLAENQRAGRDRFRGIPLP
ncbi:hypothetical protein RIF29_33199 [Crotalaria pallida]|uniref:RING-type E3 ubiquitin transferase n=1 Tax=Crotalaria pallida TaxID=3830 RepID=A0AAN9E832_CROPI